MHIASYIDIADLIATMWNKAACGTLPFTTKYQKLALLGHSLGTLGIRQYLCLTPDANKFLHSVTLFGTPLYGSPLAPKASLIPVLDAVLNKDLQQLAPMYTGFSIADALKNGNPQLRMLRAWTKRVYGETKWPKARIVLGTKDLVVMNAPSGFIDFDGDLPHDKIHTGHLDMVTVQDVNNSAWDHIVESLS